MKYFYSIASDNSSINNLESKENIADLENWHACGEFENAANAINAVMPKGIMTDGKFNYKHTQSGIAEQTAEDKAMQNFAEQAKYISIEERVKALEEMQLASVMGGV